MSATTTARRAARTPSPSRPLPHGAPVLVLRALGLGDTLTAVPALRGLRHRYPGHPLLLAAGGPPAALLERLGVVDGVLPTPDPVAADPASAAPGRALGVHAAVNLHGRGPQSHRLLQAGRPAHLLAYACDEAGAVGPVWEDDEHEVLRWLRLVGAGDVRDLRLPAEGLPPSPAGRGGRSRPGGPGGTGSRSQVVLHPGAASGARRWPPDRWGAVAAVLADEGHDVLVTGGPAERDLADEVVAVAEAGRRVRRARGSVASVAGRLALEELAALVAGADLLLCGDTGVAHVGTAFGTPSVLLFGPVPPDLWRPLVDVERHVVLWHGVGRADPHGDETDPALSKIDAAEVLGAARELLAL